MSCAKLCQQCSALALECLEDCRAFWHQCWNVLLAKSLGSKVSGYITTLVEQYLGFKTLATVTLFFCGCRDFALDVGWHELGSESPPTTKCTTQKPANCCNTTIVQCHLTSVSDEFWQRLEHCIILWPESQMQHWTQSNVHWFSLSSVLSDEKLVN